MCWTCATIWRYGRSSLATGSRATASSQSISSASADEISQNIWLKFCQKCVEYNIDEEFCCAIWSLLCSVCRFKHFLYNFSHVRACPAKYRDFIDTRAVCGIYSRCETDQDFKAKIGPIQLSFSNKTWARHKQLRGGLSVHISSFIGSCANLNLISIEGQAYLPAEMLWLFCEDYYISN
jgi:hypothetical protein